MLPHPPSQCLSPMNPSNPLSVHRDAIMQANNALSDVNQLVNNHIPDERVFHRREMGSDIDGDQGNSSQQFVSSLVLRPCLVPILSIILALE